LSWYNAAWKYRVELTIPHGQFTGDTALTLPITGANLPSEFWSHVKADGSDIVITQSDGTTKLKRQIAYINTGTQVLEVYAAWPTLSAASDTTYYLYYGNAAASESDDADTWPDTCVGAYCMADYDLGGGVIGIRDFSQYGNHGTKGAGASAPTEVAGTVGRAQEFGGDDYIEVADAVSLDLTTGLTMTALCKPSVLLGTNRILIWKWAAYDLFVTAAGITTQDIYDGGYKTAVALNAIGIDSDALLHGRYDGSQLQIYLNGSANGAAVDWAGAADVSGDPLRIGGNPSVGDAYWNGLIDELWLSSVALSPDEIAAIDAALRGSATFYSAGAVETIETIALDALLVDRFDVEPELDAILQRPAAPRGILRVDAVGILAQLAKERVRDYSASEKAVNTIVTELLALQENPNPITVGTIDYTTALSIDIDYDTILGALKRVQESVGGYIYVDSDGALQWRESIGSDVGQQLRFGKNLLNVRRTRDYSDYCSRLYAFGAGEGETQVRLGKGQSITQPLVTADMAAVWYYPFESSWQFRLGGRSPVDWTVGYPSNPVARAGAACRFPGINIPQGVTITSATLRLTARPSPGTGNDCDAYVYAEDQDNPGQFSDYTDYNTRRASYTTKLNAGPLASWTGLETQDINVTSSVQAIINRVGWSSGNAIVLWFEDHDARSTQYHSRTAYSVEVADVTRRPQLIIDFEESGAVDYVENAASEEAYGFAADEIRDVAITDPATLFEWAVQQLGIRSVPVTSYSGALADLERYGLTAVDALALGNRVRVMDEGISLDAWTNIVRLVRNLTDRMDVQVELANRLPTILDKMDFARDPRWRQHFY
jgi:hypothetical protein